MYILVVIVLIVLSCKLSMRFSVFGQGVSYPTFFNKEYTTVAKGIAILMIMICHCSDLWHGGRLLTPCGGIGVAMFLIASGYGLNESYKRVGLKSFWKKRLGRMYIPYLIVVVLFEIFQHHGWKSLLLNISCYSSPYWFVTYIVECYVVFWIVGKFLPRLRIGVLLIVSLASFCLMPALQAEQSFSFVSGVLISTYKEPLIVALKRKHANIRTCMGLLLVGLLFLGFKQIPCVRAQASSLEMNLIQCLIKLPIGLHVFFFIKCLKPILMNPMLYFAGLISYELYLVHYPFYSYIGNRIWPALLLMSFSFVIAYGFYLINNWLQKKILQDENMTGKCYVIK